MQEYFIKQIRRKRFYDRLMLLSLNLRELNFCKISLAKNNDIASFMKKCNDEKVCFFNYCFHSF